MMAVGSSLRVSAWAPESVGKRKGARLVVVNLQITPLDSDADLKIYARSDEVFRMLCARLSVTIPPFTLQRHLRVSWEQSNKAAMLQKLPAAQMKKALRDRGFEKEVRGAEKGDLARLLESEGVTCNHLSMRTLNTACAPYAWMTDAKLVKATEAIKGIRSGFLNTPRLKNAFNITTLEFSAGDHSLRIGTTGRFKEPAVIISGDMLPDAGGSASYELNFSPGSEGWNVVASPPHLFK